jgi:hypothetical protein
MILSNLEIYENEFMEIDSFQHLSKNLNPGKSNLPLLYLPHATRTGIHLLQLKKVNFAEPARKKLLTLLPGRMMKSNAILKLPLNPLVVGLSNNN